MKIVLDIPDKYIERNLYLMGGIEVIAKREIDQNWEVKTESCNMCGKCCMGLPQNHPMGLTPEGYCVHLTEESKGIYACKMGLHRPFGCCVTDPTWRSDCTIKYEVIYGNNIC